MVDREAIACMYIEQVGRRAGATTSSNDGKPPPDTPSSSSTANDAVDEALRQAIAADLESEGGHRAVLIRGPEGCGKSAAVRRAVDIISTSLTTSSRYHGDELVVIPRLVLGGVGKAPYDLLADIVLQLSTVVLASTRDDLANHLAVPTDACPPPPPPPPIEFDRLAQTYAGLLRQFSESSSARPGPRGRRRRRLVIVVDGLENIRLAVTTAGAQSSGGNLDWLMQTALPSRTHVLATYRTQPDATSSSSSLFPFQTPTRHGGATGRLRVIDVADLDESAVTQIVDETFVRLRRRLAAVDERHVTAMTAALAVQPRPLFVELVAEECATVAAPDSGGATSTVNGKSASRMFEKMTSLENVAKQRFKRTEKLCGRCEIKEHVYCLMCKRVGSYSSAV